MLSAIYSAKRRNDEGFTLIELLVVVIIIGILAAISLPIFIDQSKVAVDASVKSDVRNTVTNIINAQAQNAAFVKTAISNADTKVALTAIPADSAVGTSSVTQIATKAATSLTNVPKLGSAYNVYGWNAGGKQLLGTAAAPGWEFNSITGAFSRANAAAPDGAAADDDSDVPVGGSGGGQVQITPGITTADLADATQNKAYDEQLEATGTAPLTWSSTNLPGWLTLDADTGKLSGTPSTNGEFEFDVKAKNTKGEDAKHYTVTVDDALGITTASLPDGKVGANYSYALQVKGHASVTWSLTDGTLPDGMSFANGTLSGTPASGSYSTVNLTFHAEGNGQNDSKTLSLRVTEDIVLQNSNAELAGGGGGGWGSYWSNQADFTNYTGHNSYWSYYARIGSGGPIQGLMYCYTGSYSAGTPVQFSAYVSTDANSTWSAYSRANNWEGWGTAAGSGGGDFSTSGPSDWKKITINYTPDGNAGPLCIGAKKDATNASGQTVFMDDVTLTLG